MYQTASLISYSLKRLSSDRRSATEMITKTPPISKPSKSKSSQDISPEKPRKTACAPAATDKPSPPQKPPKELPASKLEITKPATAPLIQRGRSHILTASISPERLEVSIPVYSFLPFS